MVFLTTCLNSYSGRYVFTELRWGSLLAVASARVVRTVFCGVVGVDLAVDPWTVLVICYLRITVVLGLLSVNTGRTEESVLRLPYRNLLSELVARYITHSVLRVQGLLFTVMGRAGFLKCITVDHLIGSTDLRLHCILVHLYIACFITEPYWGSFQVIFSWNRKYCAKCRKGWEV